MARAEKYFIGPKLLSDIRRVVGRVDAEPIASELMRIPTRLQDMLRPGGSGLQLVTFTGAWNKNAAKTVTFSGTTATATALNVLATVDTSCDDPRNAFVSRVSGAWHLIAAECAY